MKICPHCHRPIRSRRSARPGHTFEMSASAPPWPQADSPAPTYTEATKRSPVRAASMDSDVFVPFFQALITSVVIAILAIPLTILMAWPWQCPLLAFCLVLPLAWWGFVSDQRSTLWAVETIINEDLNGDGYIGAQAALPPPRVEVEVREGPVTQLHDLPGDLDALSNFARGVIDHRWRFSERGAAASGYGATTFKELRTIFIERGWAVWNHPNYPQQGVALTRKGAEILIQLGDTPPSPTDGGMSQI